MISPSSTVIRDLKDAAGILAQMELSELGATVVPRDCIFNYKLIPAHTLTGDAKKEAHKVNSLVDLYYFSTVVLKKNQIQRGTNYKRSLHYNMCLSVMKDGLKEVIEIPRDHFKSTIFSECFPIWRALPFGRREEDLFSSIGYSDLFIEWMRRTHSQNIRILLISETIKNAIKLGTRIGNHYQNNADFRELFPELLPSASETWSADSLHQRRLNNTKGDGEGTYDFVGVGAALQSRHYDLMIQDDLVGKEALNSDAVMQSTIEYHQLLVGASDSDPKNPGKDFDEIIVGNRWSNKDLNSYVRENEKYFNFTTHSALGGCCELHPIGIPIFPEKFTVEKLLRWKRRLGSYYFSCQFLNYPIDPSKTKFRLADFRYFHYEQTEGALANPKSLESDKPHQKRTIIRHHVNEGDVIKDVFPRNLDRYIIVDPNHGGDHNGARVGTEGRCRHAAIVSGVLREPRRVYLLETWAKACGTDEFVKTIFDLAVKYKINKIHIEAVGAQKYLIYHLNYYRDQNRRLRPEISNINVVGDLKTPQTANAKFERIDNTIPMVERHEVWLNAASSQNFLEEAESYGQKKGLVDLLDVFGYGPQVWNFDTVSQDEVNEFLALRLARYTRGIEAVMN